MRQPLSVMSCAFFEVIKQHPQSMMPTFTDSEHHSRPEQDRGLESVQQHPTGLCSPLVLELNIPLEINNNHHQWHTQYAKKPVKASTRSLYVQCWCAVFRSPTSRLANMRASGEEDCHQSSHIWNSGNRVNIVPYVMIPKTAGVTNVRRASLYTIPRCMHM